MCGIAGIYSLNNSVVGSQDIKSFTDSMSHRGPDGSGYEWLNGKQLAFGHRRLSILDLSERGKQPMFYADRYCITFNGEIYNFEEIRRELENAGIIFRTDTDTEVILAAYALWGKACLDKFNGMWAFAIWDDQKKELFLARDRFGVKPLYYLYEPRIRFAFASETRAFKHLAGYKREFDSKLLALNLRDSYALEGLGYTPFKNILQVLPGHTLTIKKEGPVKQKRWWHIKDHLLTNIPETIEDQAHHFYKLFRDACRVRLVSDVPVATALSGGLDSTAVYSVVCDILKKENLHRTNPDSQRAFSAVFPGLPNDEQQYAALAADYVSGTVEFIPTESEGLEERIKRETEIADFIGSSPIASISAVYAGMRKAGIVVSLDGHGADEMLYGYRSMIYSLYNDALQNLNEGEAREYSKVLLAMYNEKERTDQQIKFENDLGKLQMHSRGFISKLKILVRPKRRGEFLPVALPSLSDSPYDFSKMSLPQRMLYFEFFQHSLPALLRNFDRASMINSVEVRMPFLDWRLVTYVFSLPVKSKLGNGFTKLLLRTALSGKINEELRTRTFKVGISSPLSHWYNGQLKIWMQEEVKRSLKKFCSEDLSDIHGLDTTDVKGKWQLINLALIS
jgi:asparagine synthase (glutamine-hydrolysing)